ncbi:MAG: hypothetical protein GX817_03775 [Elusimicrobia bacterium]|nr:hypothetical protein [Elusimicrobiota bacterium]
MGKGIDKLLSEITRLSEAECKTITSEAESEIKGIETDLKKKKDLKKLESEKKFRREGELAAAQIMTAARMEIKKDRLANKADLMNLVFTKASEQLSDLKGKDREKFLHKLLKISVFTGKEEVLPGKDEDSLTSALVKKINSSEKWDLTLDEKTDRIREGFILRAGEFETVVDMSALKNYLREHYEARVADELFSQE